MLKGFNSISNIQVYWKLCEKAYLQSSHRGIYQDLTEPLGKLYSYVIEYQARAICHLSSAQLSRAWKNVTGWDDWDGKATDIDDLSKRCSDCIPPLQEEEIRKNRDSQLREMHESRTILDEIRHIVKEDGKQTQRNYEDQKEKDLLQDLTSDYEGYKDFNPLRVQGTCEWFFMDDRFRKWRDSNTSGLLWVSAGPGCGKSVLSRALIDEGQLSTSVTTSTICYFFFKDGYESRMHSTDALCTILHQLFTHNPTGSLIRHALPIHRNHGEKLRQNFSELWRILVECADSLDAGEIVCVLDALDECNTDGRRQLIDKLKGFYCQPHHPFKSSSKLKFLITSRPYDDLEASFKKFSGTTAYLRFDGDDKSDQIGREIDLVIDARVDDIAGSFANKDRRKISNRLKSMQHRTYLWLHLTFDIIEQSPSEYGRLSDIETLLSNLPSQVSEAYERILGRSKNQTQTEILLQIVLAAPRPLTLDEANIALTLALRKQRFATHAALESEMWPREPRDSFKSIVKNLCGLFINVYDSKLSFIHQTAREFLIHSNPQGNWKGRLNMPKSHSTISRSCLHYFSLKDFAAPIQSDSSDQKYPFLPYAADNWSSHYISQEAAAADKSRKDARMLCDMAGPQAKLWTTGYLQQRNIKVAGWTDLALASYLGLTFVVDDILTQEVVDINAQGGHFGNALQAASSEGHEKVVELLLGKGADVNAQGGGYGNALQAALARGHEKVVELLLGKGADVNAQGGHFGNALYAASSGGHEKVVELLLGKGADVNAQDGGFSNALYAASYQGHEKVVELLLGKDADVNAQGGGYGNALQTASLGGHDKIVELLLSKGAIW
jgi:ankyrin repeat domain-containing protein 50